MSNKKAHPLCNRGNNGTTGRNNNIYGGEEIGDTIGGTGTTQSEGVICS